MRATDLTLGQIIQLLRLQEGLTQRELGERIGVSTRSIEEYEGDRIDATRRIRDIEAALGRPPGYITDWIDPYPKVAKMAEDMEQIKETLRDILAILRLEREK